MYLLCYNNQACTGNSLPYQGPTEMSQADKENKNSCSSFPNQIDICLASIAYSWTKQMRSDKFQVHRNCNCLQRNRFQSDICLRHTSNNFVNLKLSGTFHSRRKRSPKRLSEQVQIDRFLDHIGCSCYCFQFRFQSDRYQVHMKYSHIHLLRIHFDKVQANIADSHPYLSFLVQTERFQARKQCIHHLKSILVPTKMFPRHIRCSPRCW